MGIGGKFFEEAANALDAGIGVFGIDYGALADDVVGDDDGSWTREAEGQVEIGGDVLLVRVDEDEVEGFCAFAVEFGERV